MTTAAPALDPRLATLLGGVWPGLPGAATRAAELGFAWSAVSTPFVRWEGSRAVGHVGLIELPLVIQGRSRRVGSIHAVCTDADRRRRGVARALLQEAVAAGRARYDTLVLTTLIPDFYAPLGFRAVREHAFSRALPPASPVSSGGRPLTGGSDDVRLLRRLLAHRAPVSERLGSREAGTVFVIALLLGGGDLSRAHYHPALDVVTVHEVRDRTLVLYDVVGTAIPPLETLAAAIGTAADRVVTFFAPDRLGEGFRAEPWDAGRAAALGDGSFAGLMALGPLTGDDEPFMLPPMSRT
jgi:GNAT superfamily N-acetyltransferase